MKLPLKSSAPAVAWPNQPLQPMQNTTGRQSIPVQVDGFTLIPAIVSRTWTATAPNTLTIVWPN